MRKTMYQLILNNGKAVSKPVLASFGNNHRIELHIQGSGILISTVSSAQKDPEDILNGNDALFADALKKALLLYVIRYSRYFSITIAGVMINGIKCAEYSRKDSGTPLVYSLSEGKLRLPFSPIWNATSIQTVIACTSSSSYDGRFSALHALLAAKSNRYEIERFTYYWMAMNGLYNHIAAEGEKLLKAYGAKELGGREFRKLGFLDRCYGHEPIRPDGKDDREKDIHGKRLMWHVLPAIRSIPGEDIDDFCQDCIKADETNIYIQQVYASISRMNEKYEYKEQYQIFPLMVVWLPYQIRCGSFHGENALPTFCYSNDNLLRSMRVINRLLDMFVTDQLPLWLDLDAQAVNNRKQRLEKAVLNPAYQAKKN